MDINFKSFKSVANAISALFNVRTAPAPTIPAPLILLGGNRPGLSAAKIAARIIARQSEAGAPIGSLPDGQQSVAEKMEIIRVEEIIRALLEDARFPVALAPGISVTASGANAAGPLIAQGATTSIASGYGVIQ